MRRSSSTRSRLSVLLLAIGCLSAAAAPAAHATDLTDPVIGDVALDEVAVEADLLDRAPTGAEWDAGVVHCVVMVVGQRASGELITVEPSCVLDRDPRRAKDRLVGKAARDAETSDSLLGGSFTTASLPYGQIGRHWDGVFQGSSIIVSGYSCNGGWLNLSSSWINRISATESPCWVTHFTGYNLTGSFESLSWGNLAIVNNQANSLRYL